MAKKISSSDLFEQEDLFKGVRDSATKTLAVFNELQSEIKATAIGLKNELSANTQASTAQLKQFTAISEEANKLMKQSVEIEKLKAQADQQRIKAEQEIVKLEKLKAQEQARANKEAEKAAKLAQSESSAYAKLSKQLNEARKAYKDLAVTNQTNTQEAQDLLKTITALDKQLKEVDATVGQHQRNVGNYEGATRNLKTELRQLVKELQNMETTDPRFQEMTQRAGELKDQIQDTQAVVKATAGSAMENLAGSMANAGQIGVAAFQGVEASMALFGVESENVQKSLMRLTALMNLSQSLETLGAIGDKLTEVQAGFTAFFSKGMTAFQGLSRAGKAFAVTGIGLIVTGLGLLIANWDKLTEGIHQNNMVQKLSTDVMREAIASISKEVSAADKLTKQLNDENLSREEKIRKVKEFQAQYPGLLSNIDAEKSSIQQINTALTKNIGLLKLQAQAKAIQALREKTYTDLITKQMEQATGAAKEEFSLLGIEIGGITYGEDAANGIIGFANANEAATIRTNEATDALNKQIAALDKMDADIEKQIANAQTQGAVVKDNTEAEKKAAKAAEAKAKADAKKAAATQKYKQNLEELNGYIKEATQQNKEMIMTEEEQEINAIEEKYKRRLALAKKYNKGTKDIEIAYMNEVNEVRLKKLNEQIAKEQEIREEARRNQIKLQNELLDEEEKITEEAFRLTLTDQEQETRDLEEWYFEKKELFKENKETLEKLEIIYLNRLNDIRLKYQSQEKSQDEIDNEKKEEQIKKNYEISKQYAQQTTEFFKKQSDERIALIDKEIEAAEKQADIYRELAANGNINAEQSLAEQERIIAESNRRKEREMKRQQRMELANTIYQTYAGHAAQDPKTALANTIRDASLLQAFISTLPMFYEGTEDTGAGGGVDGKGGFHAVLHPHERVIPKSLNDQIGNLTNEQLTQIAQQYRNGNLVRQDIAHSSMDLAILVNEMKDLKEVIRSKPETNIELGQITQSAMEIVQQSKRGNTVVYNRFKVRK